MSEQSAAITGGEGGQIGSGNFQINTITHHYYGSDQNPTGHRRFDGPVVAVPPLTSREIDRPHTMGPLIEQITCPRAGTIAVTTGLQGAGGFGKTTLARILVHQQRVWDRFPDGIVWIGLGQEATGADLATRVGDVCKFLTGESLSLSDPHLAGAELNAT